MSNSEERRARGLEVLRGIGWSDRPQLPNMDEDFWSHTVESLFGNVWGRPGLSLRDRQIVTLGVLIALDASEGMKPHLRNCHAVGLTVEEVREIIVQAMYYAGWPRGAHAINRFNEIRKEPGSKWK
jgi:4-carboxymuconolactone decarboxylase